MNLNSTLRTTFSTAKPLTGESMNPSAGPTAAVYINGVLAAPGAPPVVANIAVGQYTLTYGLTVANGHALNDWVQITVTCTLDGLVVTIPVWEGSLVTLAADVVCLLNQTIYPMFTSHQPSTGQNQNFDGGANPVITVYRNQVATAIVAAVANPATGVWIVTLPLTGATGWAAGDVVDILAAGTIDGIPKTSWVFTGGEVVITAGGGGGSSHHEIMGHALRFQ
jgi:hypothetical protein